MRLFQIVLLMCAAALSAQVDATGVVLDQSGASIVGASVTLGGVPGGGLSAETNAAGAFRFSGLAPGTYDLRVEYRGFKTAQRRLRIGTRPPAPLKIVLQIAELREEVTVTNPDAQVSTESGENMDVIRLDRKALDRLPMLGNDIVGAATELLDSGALGTGGASIVVDGMETSEMGVSASAIQEVRINQNPYSAEYARPGKSRIEIITKPGSSEFHGSVEFQLRDHHLDARNAFAETRPPEQHRIFEGHITGPLGNGQKTSFLISGNHEDENLQSIIFARTPAGDVRQNYPNPKGQNEWSAKITRQVGENNTISVRYEFGDDHARGVGVGGFNLPETASDTTQQEHHVYYSQRSVITPKLTNELTLRVGRHNNINQSRLPGAPQIVVLDAFTGGGAQSDSHVTENHLQLTDMVSWSRGKHFVKAGLNVPDLSRRAGNDHTNVAGTFTFSTLGDYAMGRPFSYVAQQGNGYLAFWQKELGAFVQDEFKLRPNFTVTMGLRYDWQNYLADHNDFAPRLSLTFSPDKARKTVLRTGAGIFYDRTGPRAIGDTLRFDGSRLRRIVLSDPGYPDPFSLGVAESAQPTSVIRFAPNLREPYTVQYSFGVERQIQKSLAFTATYTGMTGIKMFWSRDLNAPLPPFYQARPNPAFAVLQEIDSAGRLQTHALDLGLRGKITDYFNGQIQYGIGRAYNNTGGINSFPADNWNLSGEWARANFDIRDRFRLIGTLKAGDLFDLGVALTLATGSPYSVTTGRDDNGDGRATDRPPGVPRDSRQGFGLATLDVRWAREFPLGKQKDKGPTIEAGCDAMNVLNRVNYTSVVGNLSSPFFGQPVAAKAARQLQLRVEFKF